MKNIIFTDEQFYDLDEIGKKLLNNSQDPRSLSYVRKLKRPSINWSKIILNILIPIVVATILAVCLIGFGLSTVISIVIAVVFFLAYVLLRLKRVIICIIHIYQKYAPDVVRNKCRFEPSCSEYMIIAIEKYGLIIGLQKGLQRLKRCNINGGGFDFP